MWEESRYVTFIVSSSALNVLDGQARGAGTGPAGPAAAGPMFTPSLRHDDVTLALRALTWHGRH